MLTLHKWMIACSIIFIITLTSGLCLVYLVPPDYTIEQITMIVFLFTAVSLFIIFDILVAYCTIYLNKSLRSEV